MDRDAAAKRPQERRERATEIAVADETDRRVIKAVGATVAGNAVFLRRGSKQDVCSGEPARQRNGLTDAILSDSRGHGRLNTLRPTIPVTLLKNSPLFVEKRHN